MEIAPTLKASGLDADFKLLAEFNDCVLAGRFSGEGRGVQFVTWEWGYDRKGLYHGHYFIICSTGPHPGTQIHVARLSLPFSPLDLKPDTHILVVVTGKSLLVVDNGLNNKFRDP